MRIIIVGAGEVGFHVADRLAKERHDVTVIDVDVNRLDYVSSHLDVATIEGSGASPSVLEQAGVDKAGMLLAVTSSDEVNLVCCLSARDRPDLVKVARVSNPDFYEEGAHRRPEKFGVDLLINPERELAIETFRLLQSTAATDVAVFAGGAVQLIGLHVTPDAPIAGRALKDIGTEEGQRALLTVAVERNDETIVPDGETIITPGDHLYIVAGARDIGRALELCGHEQETLKRVMLAGGSVETYYLAKLLQQHGVQAVVLVEDKARAYELAEKLEKTLILNGDATDVELLELEGVGGMDAFVALTEWDETNILASLVARHAGTKQIVTLVNKSDYLPLVRRIGLEVAVSPRLSAANAILRHVRRGSVTRVATFKASDAEVMSVTVLPDSPVIGTPLADVAFPEGAIVGAIVRGQDVVVPRGIDALAAGDTAIVFALPDAVGRVTELFPTR